MYVCRCQSGEIGMNDWQIIASIKNLLDRNNRNKRALAELNGEKFIPDKPQDFYDWICESQGKSKWMPMIRREAERMVLDIQKNKRERG